MSEPEFSALTEDDDSLAMDYVLGVLDARQRQIATERSVQDPAFATRIAGWQIMLAPLAAAAPSVEPPAGLWQRIDAAVDGETLRKPAATTRGHRLWDSLSFWRGFAFGSVGLAAVSLAALAVVAPKLYAPADIAPVAMKRGGPAGIIAAFNPRARSLLIVPAAPSASQQWVPELWLILPTGMPHSLGIVDPEQPSQLYLSPDLADQIKQSPTLAISLEPPGGSPSGQPSGPVIAEGTLHRL